MDIFKRSIQNMGPLGYLKERVEGKYAFPKFSGPISNRINFNKKDLICWSYNNYLGLADTDKIRAIDAHGLNKWGMTYPMGSRMMTGDTYLHDRFEKNFAEFVQMENALLLNFGYQGMFSIIDALVTEKDVIITDAQCHACTIDGVRLHKGSSLIYKHNDINDLTAKLDDANAITKLTGGGILIITEGVFSMSGAQGKIAEICALKEKYDFRLMVDDAHGFGVLGPHGEGTSCAQNTQDKVDLYFTTFTKSMVSFGAIIAGRQEIIDYLKYNVRSQIFSKSLPMPVVYGLNERLELVKKADDERKKLYAITKRLHDGLRDRNLLSDEVNTCITPVHFHIKLKDVLEIQNELVSKHGIYCSIVIYPVIPKDQVIFRLTPTSLHTEEDVDHTLKSFDTVFKKYMS